MLQRTTNLSTGNPRSYPKWHRLPGPELSRSDRGSLTAQCRIASNCGLFAAREKAEINPHVTRSNRCRWAVRGGRRSPGAGAVDPVLIQSDPHLHVSPQVLTPPKLDNDGHQTYLSALQSQTRSHARFSCAHEVARWPRRYRGAPRQGPQATGRLKRQGAAGVVRSDELPRRPPGACGFARVRRMRRPSEYVAVQAAGPASSLRTSGRWLSMTAAWSAAPRPAVRLGITVSGRMSPRSIDRSLVKRIVREAFRQAAEPLERLAERDGVAIAVSFRLKRPVAPTSSATRPALSAWRSALRTDADAALAALQRHLAAGESRA